MPQNHDSTLFIPVDAPGALFSVGDGHAAQGDGEVDLKALETSLTGTLQFIVHKKQHLNWPQAATPTSYITMGFNEDLNEAIDIAINSMIDFLVNQKHLTRDQAYMLWSIGVDLHITKLVNIAKGVHPVLPKSLFAKTGQQYENFITS